MEDEGKGKIEETTNTTGPKAIVFTKKKKTQQQVNQLSSINQQETNEASPTNQQQANETSSTNQQQENETSSTNLSFN
jgi:hypothetical protein